MTVNGSMEGVRGVRQPVEVGQNSVHQSSHRNHSTEEENALILFAMESHDYWSARILDLAHLVASYDNNIICSI